MPVRTPSKNVSLQVIYPCWPATSRDGAEEAIAVCSCTAKPVRLTLNICRVKFMVEDHDMRGGHTANQPRGWKDRTCE